MCVLKCIFISRDKSLDVKKELKVEVKPDEEEEIAPKKRKHDKKSANGEAVEVKMEVVESEAVVDTEEAEGKKKKKKKKDKKEVVESD